MITSLAKSLFDNVVRRRPTPFILLFEPSQRCNCRCSFCYHWREHDQGEMGLPLIREVLSQAAALGCRYLFLGGGEPLVAPWWRETLEHAQSVGLRTVLTTNGAELARRASELAPAVERISVSLDFPDERHDALRRRPGLYRAVVDGVLEAQRAGIECRLTTSVFDKNADELPALAALARDLGCRLHARLMTRESAALDGVPVLRAHADRARVARSLRRLKARGFPVATPSRYLETLETGADFRCLIGRFVVNVDALGRVYVPCPRHEGTKDRLFGRVGPTRTLGEVWHGAEAAAFRAETTRCRPGPDCYSACIHDTSRLLAPDARFWAEELLDGSSLSRFYADTLVRRLRGAW